MNEEPELQTNLRKGFTEIINRYCGENEANVPDFILGDYLVRCFNVFNHAVGSRDKWYSVHLEPHNSRFEREDAPRQEKTWSERFTDAFGHWPDGEKTMSKHQYWKEMLLFLDREAAARAEEILKSTVHRTTASCCAVEDSHAIGGQQLKDSISLLKDAMGRLAKCKFNMGESNATHVGNAEYLINESVVKLESNE